MTREEAKKRLEVWQICGECPEDKQCYDSHLHSICKYDAYCDEVSISEAVKVAIKALEQIPDLKEAYNKGYKDGQDALAYHLELCEEETEPCEDCISRAEAINAISHAELSFQVESDLNFENYKREVQEIADGILKGQVKAISNLPSIQPKPKTGHWFYDKSIENWRCSECKETPKTMGYCGSANFMSEHFKFCNHCGTRMVETQESEG